MKTFFLTFRSITQAQRAERAFARAGMSCILLGQHMPVLRAEC